MLHLARAQVGLPQRAGTGFLLSGAAAAGAALVVPGYIRPGGWHTSFVLLTCVLAAGSVIAFLGPRLGEPVIILVVLVSNAAVVLGQDCVSRAFSPVGFVLFALPTMFCALFFPRRVFTVLQAPAALVGVVVLFWAWGERGAPLALHASIALAGVLSPAVALLVLRAQLETAVVHARDQAGTDPLTGLANRRGLAARAQVVAAHAHREGVGVCLVAVDLDNFKRINDLHGHRAGDAVLERVSATLRAQTRALDVVARVGGEEFVVFSALSADDGLILAERLREQIALECVDLGMTASVGLATSTPPAHSGDVEPALWGLVDRADDFMYVAKRLGRNRVVSARAGTPPSESPSTAPPSTAPAWRPARAR